MKIYLIDPNKKWQKANLHCHTCNSDGYFTPEEIKKYYMEQGYSIVAYTDHELIYDNSHLCDDKFIAITASEFSITEQSKEWRDADRLEKLITQMKERAKGRTGTAALFLFYSGEKEFCREIRAKRGDGTIIKRRIFQISCVKVLISGGNVMHDILKICLFHILRYHVAVVQLCIKEREKRFMDFLTESGTGFPFQQKQHDLSVLVNDLSCKVFNICVVAIECMCSIKCNICTCWVVNRHWINNVTRRKNIVKSSCSNCLVFLVYKK